MRYQGRFAEALEELRRGHAIGSQLPRWPFPSATRVREAERHVELDGQLPAVLRGDVQPRTAGERVEFATLCQYKGLLAAATRLYADAFAADPALSDDLRGQHRYNAACIAALAAAGQGANATLLPDKSVVGLRCQALCAGCEPT